MATYTFQQNYPNGAANGYVKCELKPGPGELADRSYSMNLTVFDKNTARTRVHVYLKPPAGVTGDPYHVEQKTVTIPKNTATAAKITLQQRNGYLGDLPSEWWTARLIDCPVQFVVEGSAGTTDVWCVGTAAQTVRMRYMILDPRILALDFKRVALSGQDWVESDEGTAIMGDLAFSAVVTRFGLTIAKFDIACSDGTTSTINLTQAQIDAAMASGGISETQPGIFANVLFDASKKYTVTLTIGDDFETVSQQFELSDAFTNLHLSGCGKGVAVGKYSASTVSAPLFECQYPAVFYDDVSVAENGLFRWLTFTGTFSSSSTAVHSLNGTLTNPDYAALKAAGYRILAIGSFGSGNAGWFVRQISHDDNGITMWLTYRTGDASKPSMNPWAWVCLVKMTS